MVFGTTIIAHCSWTIILSLVDSICQLMVFAPFFLLLLLIVPASLMFLCLSFGSETTYSRAVKWMVFVAPADMRTRSKGRRSERANRARQMTLPKKPYRGAEANQQPSTKSASHCGFQGQKLDLCTRFADFFT